MATKVAPAAGKNVPAAKKVSTPAPGAGSEAGSKSVKKFAKNAPKGDASEPQGQYTWRVRRKLDGGDTPWKSGGPGEIMEVVLRRLEVLEGFEKSTKEIERRINNLDKNILAVAKTIMPRPPAPPKPVEPPVVAKKAAAPASKPAPAGAVAAPGAITPAVLTRDALATTNQLLGQVLPPSAAILPQKVSVIGAGPVGVNLAFAILNQGIATEIALIDSDEKRLKAEAMDMQHGMGFVKNSKVVASSDVSATTNSRLVVLTVGQGDGKMTPAELAQKNIAAFKVIIPKILEKSPHCNLLIVSNPVDAMTYAAWKISGLPPHRVIGSGTNLDSNRFRGMIADKLKLNAADCHGWIIGQHGPKSIPVWSCINVAGVNLQAINPAMGGERDEENWKTCHQEVVAAANEIAKAKSSASMGIAMSLASLVKSLLHNSREVFAVSTMVKGYHGMVDEVFMSLPCVLGDFGICDVIKQTMTQEEVMQLQQGAAEVKTFLASIKL